MSHTDKTRPLWVQFRDPLNRRYMEEVHHHELGECDLDKWLASTNAWIMRWVWPKTYNCFLYHNYYGGYHNEFWRREPHRGARFNRHHVARAQWRAERQRLLAGMDPDDMEPTPDARVYDSWMWEKWRS